MLLELDAQRAKSADICSLKAFLAPERLCDIGGAPSTIDCSAEAEVDRLCSMVQVYAKSQVACQATDAGNKTSMFPESQVAKTILVTAMPQTGIHRDISKLTAS